MPRPFDWERLLKEQRIPFVDSGPNVKRGELAIRCPFCGSADPSKHMGLSLETGWWSCWRNRSAHSGKSPLRLIMRLLEVPYGRARELAGLGDDYVDPEGFDAVAARLLGRGKVEGRPEQIARRHLELDPEFREVDERGRTSRHYEYLRDRGFTGVYTLCDEYRLMAGTSGPWVDRVILPYYQDKKLVTWTGRAIAPSRMRYRDLELAESIAAPKDVLFNHDAIYTGGKALVIVEGPFDALKLDYYAQGESVRAVALSTNSISDEQAFLLQNAVDRFDQIIVMLDNATVLGIVDSMRMKAALNFLPRMSIQKVPFGAKDAGELRPGQVQSWAESL